MSTKAEKKKNEKVINDRTFGLKNKNKSKAVQKYVKGVEQTVKHMGGSAAKIESDEYQRKKLKKKEQEQKALLNSLFNDAKRVREDVEQQQDPRTIVCPYFKQGLCQKGKKCIYSHDLTLDRTEDIDLYVDQRTQLIMNALGGKQMDSMSEQQLTRIIGQKQADMMKGCRSQIVCKFFLQAAEKQKYGWNWSCPNGGDKCRYKHCLPPGYRLRKDHAGDQQDNVINIEEKIDEQRNRLLSLNKQSPLVTYDIFLKWKEEKVKRKELDMERKKKQDEKRNKEKRTLRTGKQLFNIDPTLFVDDEQAADDYDDREIIEEEDEHSQGNRQNEMEDRISDNQNDNLEEIEQEKSEVQAQELQYLTTNITKSDDEETEKDPEQTAQHPEVQ